ncbi:RRM_XMAS2 and SAC3_GANP domain-containing protein xmas [Cochliomyia hominivorax]
MPKDVENEASERKINYNALTCQNIPELFLDKVVAKKHFGKFGKIKRFILRPKRLTCTVEYECKENAENAYMNAGNYNGIDFEINYAEYEVAHIQNTEEWVDPDVQAELEAMFPGHRLGSNLRTSAGGFISETLQKTNILNRVTKHTNNYPNTTSKVVKMHEIEKQEVEQPEITKIDSAVRNELEAILKTPAFTDEEKYRVLEARDKLLRMTTIRQTDINKAVATKGTCPDMCPEKERLMREFQRQVSIFEMADEEGSETTISHKKAVKEYSRSSADQEVPLSHELRSEPVLQMTMLYLVHRVMGLCDDPKTSLGDWFHFVWDRTRSIRKDITQQELCSLGSVELVEQCARFHIHCAARLVSEDPSVFDKKINAENLTKCLQTLKYMYHDLRIKGIVCPCEAEFRSYIILLNLGDSNFLWEVKQLPEIIQKNTEIKRAIEFYNALQNNNFVRFFSMIRSSKTSYLSACILLGYFTKLRVRAMDAIIKSHSWRKNDVYLPFSYLTRVMGFDEESSAISFFEHYGLHCDRIHKRVLLDRLVKPEIEYAMDRALQLVESKRKVSVGECVFGKTLPSPSLLEYHQPHNSFDTNGFLKIEAWTATDQIKGNLNIQKEHKDLLEKNLSSRTDTNLFKVPQNLATLTSKQHKLQEQNNLGKAHEITLGSFTTEENNSSTNGFKYSGNIFGGAMSVTNLSDSIIKSPLNKMESVLKQNTLMNTIFQFNTKNVAKNMGNIFVDISTNNETNPKNVLNSTTIETDNIFQNNDDKHPLKENEEYKYIQNNNHISNISSLEKEMKHQNDSEEEVKKEFQQIHIKRGTNTDGKPKNVTMGNTENAGQTHIYEKERLEKLNFVLQERSQQECEQIISELVEKEVLGIAQEEITYLKMIIQASHVEQNTLLNEVVSKCVADIANEEYAHMSYNQLLVNRCFSRWLMYLRKRKDQMKLIENIPIWATTNTRAECAQALKHPCEMKSLEMIKRYRFGQSCDFNNILGIERDICEEDHSQINLFDLVGQHLLSKQSLTSSSLLKPRKYFKIVITLPEDKEELTGFESYSNNWLTKFIKKARLDSGPFVHDIEHNIALCVRKFNGIICKNEQGVRVTTEGDHNDGLICFITGINVERHSRKRLYNLLKLTKNFKRVPLAIIAYNCSFSKEELAIILGLDILQKDGLICSYIIIGCQISRKDFSFRKMFIKAVDFIAKESILLNSNEIYAMAMQNARCFLETSLGEELWQRWGDSANINPIFNKICSLPIHVVGIFNNALDHLLQIIQEDLQRMPEFPKELKEFVPDNTSSNMTLSLEFFPLNWKTKTNKTLITTFLESLYLPNVNENVPNNIEDLKLWILKYTSVCVGDDDIDAAKSSYEAITNLLSQVNLYYMQNKELTSSLTTINYLTVMKPIINSRIDKMLKYFSMEFINMDIIYLKDSFENYKTQPWWLNYEPLKFVNIDYKSQPCLDKMILQKNSANTFHDEDIDKILTKAEEISYKAECIISEHKRRKLNKTQMTSMNLPSTINLKRKLDVSMYQFELSKEIGKYNTSFVSHLTDDIDKSISEVLDQTTTATQPNSRLNIDNVISKAMDLINEIESEENQKIKNKKYDINYV